jgi:hypothetical protein
MTVSDRRPSSRPVSGLPLRPSRAPDGVTGVIGYADPGPTPFRPTYGHLRGMARDGRAIKTSYICAKSAVCLDPLPKNIGVNSTHKDVTASTVTRLTVIGTIYLHALRSRRP